MASPSKHDETAARTAWLPLRTPSEWTRAACLPRAAAGVLTAAIVAQAAHTSWNLWALARMPAVPRSAAVRPLAAHRLPDARQLVAAHLFGRIPEAAAPEGPAAIAAQWVLTGTLQGSSPAAGAAILGRTVGTTRFFATGQEV